MAGFSLKDELASLAGEVPNPRGLHSVPVGRPTVAQWLLQPEILERAAELARLRYPATRISKELGISNTLAHRAARQHRAIRDAYRGIMPVKLEISLMDPELPQKPGEPAVDPACSESIDKIQEWARNGVSVSAIATLLGIVVDQFDAFTMRVPAVAGALRLGRAEREALAGKALAGLLGNPDHKDHIRAVLATMDRTKAREDVKDKDEGNLSAEQILARLRSAE